MSSENCNHFSVTEVVGNTDHNFSKMPKNTTVSKSWFLTLNNWTEEELKFAKAVPAKRKIVAKETGKQGTPHLHMAYVFKKAKRFSALKKMFPRANIQRMRGTWADQEYLLKDGDAYVEDNSKQGQRQDIIDFVKDAQELDQDAVIQRNPACWCKYQKAYQKLREITAKKNTKKFRELEVIVHWGVTGTGKTRTAYESSEDVYKWTPSTPEWWDGYEGEETLLIDEFYGQLKPARLLQVLDGYQLRLPIKGGFTYANWRKVYITSNVPWFEWYNKGNVPDTVIDALKRRITRVVHFSEPLTHPKKPPCGARSERPAAPTECSPPAVSDSVDVSTDVTRTEVLSADPLPPRGGGQTPVLVKPLHILPY